MFSTIFLPTSIKDHPVLRHYDGRKYIKLNCLGFPDDALKFDIYYAENGTRSRLDVNAVTIAPRPFKMQHVFDLDYEPEEKDIKLDVIDTGKLLVTINVPQEIRKWKNEEIGDYTGEL